MMDESLKQAIFTMREQGATYAKIAERFILSQNTVKSVCRRNGAMISRTNKQEQELCRCCGKPLRQNEGGRKRSFCSDSCRYNWWNKYRRKQPYHLICHYCGKKFISFGNRKRKFCGRECYILSRYGEGLP